MIESTLGLESDGGSDDALDDEGAERRQIQIDRHEGHGLRLTNLINCMMHSAMLVLASLC